MATVPAFIEGPSLLPVLSAARLALERWRQIMLIEHYGDTRSGRRAAAIPEYHALRVKDFSYVEYATAERELYDLRRDPYQLQNAVSGTDQAFTAQLAACLSSLRRCAAPYAAPPRML